MPSRQSRKRSRAQQRRRKQSMKGGRRGDEKLNEEENPKEEEKEEKKEEEKDTGILGGLFGSDDKKAPDVPTQTTATAETNDKEEEGGMFSGLMGKKDETLAVEKKGKKGKRGKKGKYYTTKQLKKACARLAHNKRLRSKKKQRMYVAPPFQGNVAFEQNQNPYEFGPRM